jgi:hypothetical protein
MELFQNDNNNNIIPNPSCLTCATGIVSLQQNQIDVLSRLAQELNKKTFIQEEEIKALKVLLAAEVEKEQQRQSELLASLQQLQNQNSVLATMLNQIKKENEAASEWLGVNPLNNNNNNLFHLNFDAEKFQKEMFELCSDSDFEDKNNNDNNINFISNHNTNNNDTNINPGDETDESFSFDQHYLVEKNKGNGKVKKVTQPSSPYTRMLQFL